VLASWLSTTNHKVIGHLYLITSFGFFLIAGLMAMIMRAQLYGPGNHIVSDQQYNEIRHPAWTAKRLQGLFWPGTRPGTGLRGKPCSWGPRRSDGRR
jgi:hypothetical protein